MNYVLRPATESDFPAIIALINAQAVEPTTLDQFLHQEKLWPKEDPRIRLVAENVAGQVVAYGTAAGGRFMREATFQTRVRVDAAHRGQGLGGELLRQVEQWAMEHGARRLESSVQERDVDSVAWVGRHGYTQEYHMFESTLPLERFDGSHFADSLAAARDIGFRFTTLAEEGGNEEAVLRRFYDFALPIMFDQPGVDGVPAPPFELWLKATQTDPTWRPEGVILAVKGDRWAGLSHVVRLPSGAMYNGFTGVARDFRDQGLTLPMKVVALRYAQREGAPYIRTNNHSANQRMLAVNRKLGYVPEPGLFSVVKQVVSGGYPD